MNSGNCKINSQVQMITLRKIKLSLLRKTPQTLLHNEQAIQKSNNPNYARLPNPDTIGSPPAYNFVQAGLPRLQNKQRAQMARTLHSRWRGHSPLERRVHYILQQLGKVFPA